MISETGFTSVISGFRREEDEIRALLGCYAASSGNFVPKFTDNLSVPSSGIQFVGNPEVGTDRLSLNVSKKLLLLAAE